ncbi:hypothetical protein [Nocardia brasiliensis]|uniref:YcaO domain-containing protein n=1 Tax=Nocardia brasiliensis (strain ATCC 700358 / HUJEG-1) TaxID=1133849 RepID=K0F229_NOCB7|nr:hypothetical protein [Nocardia brasiliensis]AFU03747.1 hypothetical protein O3I_028990 [Nocardia brasiliensis ATCC 700358]OCF89525.1 hypothetical protein AW168_14225 [Nocardia brasiliensis]
MRPRLHPAVRYVACPDGVYLFGDRGARTLRGARAFDWLSRLEPYLNGSFELEELTAALPAEQRSTVEGMVSALHEHGFVTDAQGDLPHHLSEADLRIYAREIAFLACAIDAPEHRFQRHREARVTVLGSAGTERVVTAVVAAGVRSGWANVCVGTAGRAEDEVLRAVDTARRDEHQRVALTPDPELRDTDVVLQIADTTAELTSFAQQCPDDVALAQLLIGSEEAWITEAGTPADISCWKRLRANRRGPTAPGPNRWLTGPVPAILAAHLVLGVFRHRTGLSALPAPTPGGPRVTRVDLRTLDMTVHRVTPIHAVAEHDSPPPGRYDNLAATPDELLTRAALLVDEYTGALSAFGEGDLPQFPLSHCRATVSDPAEVIPFPASLPSVTGWGPDQHTSRTRTVLRALAVHAWLTAPAISAVDLVTGRTLARPARSARDRANPLAIGVAAGLTRSAAVEWGLRQQCEALLLERRAEWTARSPLADDRIPLDDNGVRLLHQLDVVGSKTTVLDLGDILGVPAYAVRTAHGHEVVSCATTAQDALRGGMERALLAWQGHPDVCAAATLGTSEHPDLLAKSLREAGFSTVAVELADELALVHCVRVVLDAA